MKNADRLANRQALTDLLAAATHLRHKAELLAACEEHGVPAGAINDMGEVFANPQVISRGLKLELEGVPGVRSPFTFSDAELVLDKPSPRLGEDD